MNLALTIDRRPAAIDGSEPVTVGPLAALAFRKGNGGASNTSSTQTSQQTGAQDQGAATSGANSKAVSGSGVDASINTGADSTVKGTDNSISISGSTVTTSDMGSIEAALSSLKNSLDYSQQQLGKVTDSALTSAQNFTDSASTALNNALGKDQQTNWLPLAAIGVVGLLIFRQTRK